MSSIHTKMTAICDAIREKTGGTELLTLDDMATEIAGISTGVELNFEVVGGTTQPENPTENMIWVNTDQEITSWDFSATEPVLRSGTRNLIRYPYYHTTMTTNGITFTDNGDGTITANGTATAEARFRPFHTTIEAGLVWLEPGTYYVSGCPSGGSSSTYYWQVYDHTNGKTLLNDYGNGGGSFTLTSGTYARGSIIIKFGVTMNNVVFHPQLERGSTSTAFIKGEPIGQVWISTGIGSGVEFNVLKTNSIQVYPILAKQYIGGVWVNKSAQSYQDGEWKGWLRWENIALTSDVWSASGFGQTGSTSGTGNVANGKITLAISASNVNYGADAWAYTKVKMDLSRVKTIEFTITLSNTAITFARAGVSSNAGATPTYLASIDFSKSTSQQTKTLDVTDITEGYIHFSLRNTTTTGTAYCKEIISSVRIETT